MIITRLKGGLGNQLFQYAAGIALAKRQGLVFKIDISYYRKSAVRVEIIRNLDISDFAITAPPASDSEVATLKYPIGILSKFSRAIEKKVLRRHYVDWHPNLLLKSDNIYLDGYFQSEKYFNTELDLIFSQYTLRAELLNAIQPIEEIIKQKSVSISLHIRRGDYADQPKISRYFLVCDASYYQRAINFFLTKFPDCHFFIFSDDVRWVRENLESLGNVTYVSSTMDSVNLLRSSQELTLMSKCNHHILSNSSFSWWGAYLNQSPKKIVLAPDIWNNGYVAQPNIAPNGWIRFPVKADM